MDKVINGIEIREFVKNKLKEKISFLEDKLKLVVIQVGNDPASNVYVKNKGKLCNEVGILFEHKKFDNISEEDLIFEIKKINRDNSVTGILVQLPLSDNIDENNIIEAISPLKDVDGLTSANLGKLYSGLETIAPCTALGVMEIFKYMNIDLEGLNVTVVGRSKLVGIPLVSLLLRKNATVTMCHSKTKNLKEKTSLADVLIVAVGKKELIKEDYVKKDAIVIDVGINRFDGKLYGDCDYSSIYDNCKYITPVPGGVGPLTVVMLVHNVLKAYYLQK